MLIFRTTLCICVILINHKWLVNGFPVRPVSNILPFPLYYFTTHQVVCINNINFQRKSVIVSTHSNVLV